MYHFKRKGKHFSFLFVLSSYLLFHANLSDCLPAKTAIVGKLLQDDGNDAGNDKILVIY